MPSVTSSHEKAESDEKVTFRAYALEWIELKLMAKIFFLADMGEN